MPPPLAAIISIRATLVLLDNEKREIAEAVANDEYAFWLGSGISLARLPNLSNLAKRVLTELQSRVDQADPNCRFRKALTTIIALTAPSDDEMAGIDFGKRPDQWSVFDTLATRLVSNYARMLNVTVDGEEADFLLWDVLDAANVYADPAVEPDVEHYCLAALALEGVASEIPSANWDPLIERAVSILAGSQPVLRVAVAPEDTRSNRRRANLYKFHGCAQAALDDPVRFRSLLIARQNQINGWAANNPVMGNFLTQLILTKPTLMLGLSAQDANIQGLFAAAEAQMAWRWSSNPPAYAFSENALGGDQESLLQNVYRQDYTAANRSDIGNRALVQAYAKPLLLSLLLYVLTTKLKMLVQYGAPDMSRNDRIKLCEGLMSSRNHIADVSVPTTEAVVQLLRSFGRAMTMLREGALPQAANGLYSSLSIDPVDRMPGDPNLAGNGICQFAIASGLIGLGLERGLWSAEAPDTAITTSGAFTLVGRSGPAKIYFAANPRAAIRLRTNGLVAANDDAVIVHSHASPTPMPRSPLRPPGRTGLATIREVGIEELLTEGTEIEDLLNRFRSKVAL